MIVIDNIHEMQQTALALRRQGKRIGFVPTMGFLHEGHISLIKLARAHADIVVVSIFVNPTQFAPSENYAQYPRSPERDEALCRKEGVDYIFCPTVETMYQSGHSVFIHEEKLSKGLCGASRPGHFRGVMTVVAKLFNIVQPHAAVFGEKDGQQLRIIQRLVRDLNFPVEIIAGPTVRESDGLAMSSRNSLLSERERKDAVVLKQSLDMAVELYKNSQRDAEKIKRAMTELIAAVPNIKIEYIEITDNETLEPVKTIQGACLVAVAVRFPSARLIDNVVLHHEQKKL